LCNSHYTAHRIQCAHPDIKPISVCHLALTESEDELFWGRSGADVLLPEDDLVLAKIQPLSVLIVGRMVSTERHKGQDLLIQAWPQIKTEIPDAQLVIVGEGDDMQRLRNLSGGAPSIFFTGRVSDKLLKLLYQRAALFAMPSSMEGFGIAYLEAMKFGLPCIASTEDAAREVVVDGETGFLVDRKTPRTLVGAIVTCLKDPDLRIRMGTAGRARLCSEFSFDRFKQRFRQALDPMVSNV
jgi:phosphatidylinositol alpha-1,6-mannosyltransferase